MNNADVRAGLVSVVVVNYRGADDTITCLKRLAELDFPPDRVELICVDNASGDGSFDRIRAAVPDNATVQAAAAAARGLADGTRLSIAAALATGEELCVCDMAWVVGLSQGLVSHHLRQLKNASLVSSSSSTSAPWAQRSPAKVRTLPMPTE